MFCRNEFKACMVRKGLTQKQLAQAVGFSEQTLIRKMKTGVFRTDEVEKIMRILEIEHPESVFFAKEVTL